MRISSKKATRAALRRSAVAALGLAVCGSTWALSLGRIVLQSGRGEPLRAEVELEALGPEEAASLAASIAPAEAYQRAGVSPSPSLAEAQVSLAQRADGRQVLRISSPQPVDDAFLDLILQVNWASGSFTREYTLLFEAPRPVAQEPAPVAAPLLGPAPTPSLPAVPREEIVEAPPRVSPKPAPAAPDAPETRSDRYTVRKGDTLSGVASRMSRPGVSLDQMLVALYRGNPQAFINKNMNLLRADSVLRMPSAEQAAQVARGEARQVVRLQSNDFEAYRARLAHAAPAARVEESARRSGGAVEAAIEDRQTAPSTPDRLRLSRAPNSAAPEAALSREVERRDQAQRVAELSRNVEELRRLAASSSNTVVSPEAAAASAAASASALGLSVPGGVTAAAPAVPTAASAASDEASAPEAAVPEAAASAIASAPGALEAASAPEALAAASAASAVDFLPPREAAADEAPSPARHWWIGLAGVLGALVLGGAGVMLLRKRKKAAAETSFLESKLQPDSFFGGGNTHQVETRESAQPAASEQYSLSQLDAIGDVDPVAEADVYLAYGRDLQAEEILKEAMRSNPQRLSIRTKLLEVYAKRRDVKAFELLAQQLHQITQGQGKDWAQVRELGLQIDPDNRLYDETADEPRIDEPRPEPDTMSPSTWPEVEAPAPKAVPKPVAQPPAERLDLDLDQLANAPARSLEQTRPVVTSMERPAPVAAPAPAPVAAPAVAAAVAAVASGAAVAAPAFQDDPAAELQAEDDDSVSLDFGLAAVPAPAVPSEGAPSLPFDLDSLSLDLDEPSTNSVLSELNLSGFDAEEGDDALQRKLELAEEFRQIGENDAARDLLQEVVAEASGDVKTRAQGMLDSLV